MKKISEMLTSMKFETIYILCTCFVGIPVTSVLLVILLSLSSDKEKYEANLEVHAKNAKRLERQLILAKLKILRKEIEGAGSQSHP